MGGLLLPVFRRLGRDERAPVNRHRHRPPAVIGQRRGNARRVGDVHTHRAIGGGQHAQITASPYTFSRVLDNDKVVVAFGVSGSTTLSVGSIFSNGTVVKDYYTGNTATVTNGSVTLTAGGVALLEAAE